MERFLQQIAAFWRPHVGQRAFLEAPNKIKVLACGRRWGKTDACAIQVLERLTSPSPIKQLLVAPTLEQARLLFDRIVELLEPCGFPPAKARGSPHPRLTVAGHSVMARSAAVPRSLRGLEAHGIVVDEAAFVPEKVITEVLWPMLATTNGSMTLISTPNGLNAFWRLFRRGERGELGIWSRQAPSWENPMVSPEFLAVQREIGYEKSYAIEYGAEFLDITGAVFRQEAIDASLVTADSIETRPPYSVGVDWAMTKDFTAVAVMGGNRDRAHLVHLDRFNRCSWEIQVERVEAILREFPRCSVLCDATGIGSPLTEMLQRKRPDLSIRTFGFNQKSKPRLVEGLLDLFERGAIRMAAHGALLQELQEFHGSETATGHIQFVGTSGHHDDLVIALALAAAALPDPYPLRIQLAGPRPGV
ncbi:MAG: terminase large subunit domain-containing protein [Fimbriimonas sp.]